MRYALGRIEMLAGFWWRNRKERYHYNLCIDRRIILIYILQSRLGGHVLTIRRMLGRSGGLL
jgi:hypothetical protein